MQFSEEVLAAGCSDGKVALFSMPNVRYNYHNTGFLASAAKRVLHSLEDSARLVSFFIVSLRPGCFYLGRTVLSCTECEEEIMKLFVFVCRYRLTMGKDMAVAVAGEAVGGVTNLMKNVVGSRVTGWFSSKK